MENIVNYAQNEMRTFDEYEFNQVDSVIFSWLSYLIWDNSVFEEFNNRPVDLREFYRAEIIDKMTNVAVDADSTKKLFLAVMASPRYRGIKAYKFVDHLSEELEKQFSAITFVFKDEVGYVSFRGTDSTFVGWKEDFNMSFKYPVPAQEEAAKYLKEVSEELNCKFIVGGHSKGGNIAIYSVANNPDLYDRIIKIYSHDGPGFLKEVIESESYQKILNKVDKTVPQSSIIGMLLEQHANYHVVSSKSISLWQHNPFTWEVENSSFKSVEDIEKGVSNFDNKINEWLVTLSIEDREKFINSLFDLFESLEVKTLKDLGKSLPSNLPKIMENFNSFDEETKKFLFSNFSSLIKTFTNDFVSSITKNIK